MELWLETTMGGLYASALSAFPKTSMRQHATHEVRVEHLQWIPFQGVGTLFVKGVVRNEGRKNDAIVLFKGVKYRESEGRGVVPVASSDGKRVYVERLGWDSTHALVRCSCADFRWRFAHWNRGDGSLFGRGPRKYEAKVRPESSNPDEMPGMCKHIMKMAKILAESGVLDAVTGQIGSVRH